MKILYVVVSKPVLLYSMTVWHTNVKYFIFYQLV